MKTETSQGSIQEKVCLALPGEIVADLKRIAAFNDMEFEKLLYSYIVDGLAADARTARRVKFTDKTNEVLRKYHVPPKTVEEIFTHLVE